MFDPTRLKQMQESFSGFSQQMQQKMDSIAVEASSGGGMVTVRMNGKKQLLSLRIDPSLISSSDVEMLQDLILAAVNEAGRKADDTLKQGLTSLVGGINLPGLL